MLDLRSSTHIIDPIEEIMKLLITLYLILYYYTGFERGSYFSFSVLLVLLHFLLVVDRVLIEEHDFWYNSFTYVTETWNFFLIFTNKIWNNLMATFISLIWEMSFSIHEPLIFIFLWYLIQNANISSINIATKRKCFIFCSI